MHGLSEATSQDMMHENVSLKSHNVNQTPSSFMGSHNGLNTSAFLATSPAQPHGKDTMQTPLMTQMSAEARPNKQMMSPGMGSIGPQG